MNCERKELRMAKGSGGRHTEIQPPVAVDVAVVVPPAEKETRRHHNNMHGGGEVPPATPPPTLWTSTTTSLQWLVAGQRLLVVACCVLVAGGLLGGMLLGRLYYNRGGTKIWLYTVLQSIGWPLLLPPLFLSYYRAWRTANPGVPFRLRSLRDLARVRSAGGAPASLKLLAIFAAIGFISSIDYFLFTIGVSYLPVSTDALLTSSQLAFNALFSFLLLRHRFTAGSLNAVFIITVGAVLLGLRAADASTERPPGVTQSKYVVGFASAIAAAALFGLIYALLELTCVKVIRKATICVVIEAQVVVAMFATFFSLCGMAINREYPALPREGSTTFDAAGPSVYSLVLVAIAVSYQIYFVATVGLIFIVSSLFSNLITTASFPIVALAAIPSFGDSFNSLKVIAMVLALWGLMSYVYGGYRDLSKDEELAVVCPDEPSAIEDIGRRP